MGSKHSQNNQYSDDKRILFEFIKKSKQKPFRVSSCCWKRRIRKSTLILLKKGLESFVQKK